MVLQSSSQISDILRKRDFLALRQALKNWSPSAVGRALHGLSIEDQMVVFRILPRDLAAQVFGLLELSTHEQLRKATGREELAWLLNDMALDGSTILL